MASTTLRRYFTLSSIEAVAGWMCRIVAQSEKDGSDPLHGRCVTMGDRFAMRRGTSFIGSTKAYGVAKTRRVEFAAPPAVADPVDRLNPLPPPSRSSSEGDRVSSSGLFSWARDMETS